MSSRMSSRNKLWRGAVRACARANFLKKRKRTYKQLNRIHKHSEYYKDYSKSKILLNSLKNRLRKLTQIEKQSGN